MILRRSNIVIVIILFFIAKLLTIANYNVLWWDTSVYIGMGKYIYSSGNSGLWEYTRPIVWPLVLGFFWKSGIAVLFGRILEIVFGGLCVLLTYLIGKKLFNHRTALLSSIFLAFSPTFFFFNGIMLTEVVSTFFSLLAIYLFIGKKHFASGMLFGIAFMTRYLQLFVFVAALLFNIKNMRNLKRIILGFAAAIAPILILNQAMYGNAIFPFFQQLYLSQNSGWLNQQPLNFYLIELFRENFLYLLFILGLFLAFKNKNANSRLIAFAFIFFFVFFSLIKQKEMRFLIVLLPYMYILLSTAISSFLGRFNNLIWPIYTIIAVSLMLSSVTIYGYYKKESNKANQYDTFQDMLEKTGTGTKIWISSPMIAVSSNRKIDEMMYYPVFNEERKERLIAGKADFVFLDSCDLACRAYDDKCENAKEQLIAHFKKRLKLRAFSKVGECRQFVFAK
ncbi:glycosyltransferase family 39 protein [Candidatus Woesearchaeota archaeon]|nr:glycosyltransferase family 39 protein [Candidatus Woesearchaeota archaeon]